MGVLRTLNKSLCPVTRGNGVREKRGGKKKVMFSELLCCTSVFFFYSDYVSKGGNIITKIVLFLQNAIVESCLTLELYILKPCHYHAHLGEVGAEDQNLFAFLSR